MRNRGGPPPGPPAATTIYSPDHAIDLKFALMGIKTVMRRDGVHWWSTTTPSGPASMAFREASGQVKADSWGPGAAWAIEQLPMLLGANDTTAIEFRPQHRVVQELLDQFSSIRIGASGRWYEALATGAIGQRVVAVDAARSRVQLARRHGDGSIGGPAPLFPTPEQLLGLNDQDFHRVGIERSRARVLRVAAKYAERLEQLDEVPGAAADEWLRRLPGIGPWTAGLTTAAAGGDPDAVPVGDLHIPRLVTLALCGEAGNDDRMLELLEPFKGHRQRVVRLVELAGAEPSDRPAPFRYDISEI